MGNENSKIFEEAYNMAFVDKKQAIKLYDDEIAGNPDKFIAWNNRGLCKLELAQENKDRKLLEESKNDFKQAIALSEKEGKDYGIAKNNFRIAEETKF